MDIDWYNQNWLDNRWMRVKVALHKISCLPKTYYLTEGRNKIEYYTVTWEVSTVTLIQVTKRRNVYLRPKR